jgi:hypothetical protein
VTARSSSCSRARDQDAQNSAAYASPTSNNAAANPDARRRTAITPRRGQQTQLEVVIRTSKRGRTRTIPLHAEAHDALRRGYAARPATASDALFVSLHQRRSATSKASVASAVGDVVAKHATAAGVREDRRTAHALRHRPQRTAPVSHVDGYDRARLPSELAPRQTPRFDDVGEAVRLVVHPANALFHASRTLPV